MPTTNRNAPCPCGSGRKYKNCCLRRDLIAASRLTGLPRAEGALLTALFDYAQQPRYQPELRQAMEVYWGGQYDLRNIAAEDADDVRRAVEWFAHDHRVGAERRRVIDLFVESETRTYAPEMIEILNAWRESALAVLRVTRLGDGQVEAYDLLRQDVVNLTDATAARTSHEGDLLIGRMFVLAGQTRMSPLATSLPSQYEQPLAEYLRNAYTLYVDEHAGASRGEFLRENGHLVTAYLLSTRSEALRVYIGPGTVYHDPSRLRDRVRERTRLAQVEAQRQREREERAGRGEREYARTASGLVLPGAPEPPPSPGAPAAEPRPRILIPGRDA